MSADPKDEEHLFLSQLRKHPGNDAEVRLYVDGKLVCGTWPYQVTESIDAMVNAGRFGIDRIVDVNRQAIDRVRNEESAVSAVLARHQPSRWRLLH